LKFFINKIKELENLDRILIEKKEKPCGGVPGGKVSQNVPPTQVQEENLEEESQEKKEPQEGEGRGSDFLNKSESKEVENPIIDEKFNLLFQKLIFLENFEDLKRGDFQTA
jgi:hypothetical protein